MESEKLRNHLKTLSITKTLRHQEQKSNFYLLKTKEMNVFLGVLAPWW